MKTIANDRTWRCLRATDRSQVADTRLGRQAYGRRGVFTEILNRLYAPAVQANIITTATATQFIEADSWDQQITTGCGNDVVIAGQWELPAGSQDADIVNTGEGSDLVFTGQGRDIINTGAGDDFIMSGGLASVLSLQSEDPGNQAPAGATWSRAGMGSWGLYNDSANGDLGGRLTPYGISTAQFWQAGTTDVEGADPQTNDDDCQEFAIGSIANNGHSTLGIDQFYWMKWRFSARGDRGRLRHRAGSSRSCMVGPPRCPTQPYPRDRVPQSIQLGGRI